MRIFVTHIVPKEKIMYYRVATAACNFSYNLIEGNIFDRVYSILPSNIVGDRKEFECSSYELIYSVFRNSSSLLKLAPIFEQIHLFRKIKKGDYIWLYNLDILTGILVLLLRLFKPSVKIFPIVLDFTPDLKINKLFLTLINKSNGIIKLSTSSLFTVKNSITIPGVVPTGVQYTEISSPISKEFLISGVLYNELSMMPMLLNSFSKMPELKLHITGKAREEDVYIIKEYAQKYPNIIYYGKVSYEDFLHLLDIVPFVLSTRDPSAPENQCNFPSKIIEALLHNKIIVSTIHYPQLDGIKYFEVESESNKFMEGIIGITNMRDDKLLTYANQSVIVKTLFSTNVWNQAMTKIEIRS